MGHGGYPVLSEDPTTVNEATQTRKPGTCYRYYDATYGWWTMMYVKLCGLASATAGMVAEWANQATPTPAYAGMVTVDRSSTGESVGDFAAGVFVGAVTVDYYGFIVCGYGDVCSILGDGSVAAGDPLIPHASTDGAADTGTFATTGGKVFGQAITADATTTNLLTGRLLRGC